MDIPEDQPLSQDDTSQTQFATATDDQDYSYLDGIGTQGSEVYDFSASDSGSQLSGAYFDSQAASQEHSGVATSKLSFEDDFIDSITDFAPKELPEYACKYVRE
jgi:hypothetical protein